MTQIEELQGRILAAMERISSGVGKLEQASAEAQEAARVAADTSEIERELEEERTANAQLEERVKVLNARLKELDQGQPAAASDVNSGDMEALQAELELLRNEVGNTDEKDALKQEVSRLKVALESTGNGLAAEKEALETQIAELSETNASLQAQINEAANSGEADLGNAVDQAALEAEIAALKNQLAEAQAKADGAAAPVAAEAQPEAADAETLVRLDAELQKLRLANEQLRSSNAALRQANADGLADADLINTALAAEVEGLRAAQASDQAQVNAVLAKLEPLLANAQNLPEGEEV